MPPLKKARSDSGSTCSGGGAATATTVALPDHAIASLRCALYRVPLAEVLVDAKHGDHSHFELITVTITTGKPPAAPQPPYRHLRFCTSLSRRVRCALRQTVCVVCYGGYPAWILVVGGGGGTGYTYTGGKGGLAIQAMVEADLAPILVGKDARRVERLYEDMTWHVHYVARGGVASFAVSAVDIALWDLKCKCAGIVTCGAVRHSVLVVDVCSAQC
eukprot:COSAG01_NODE_23183_length_825_cov_1.038567_1_plen_217_part_00